MGFMSIKIRIILDINIFISYFFASTFRQKVDQILYDDSFTLLSSDALLREIKGVLLREKFKSRIKAGDVERILEIVSLNSFFQKFYVS